MTVNQIKDDDGESTFEIILERKRLVKAFIINIKGSSLLSFFREIRVAKNGCPRYWA